MHKGIRRRPLERAARKSSSNPPNYWRPRTYGECIDLPRPCPYAGCRYHLMLDVRRNGSISMNAEDIESMTDTCALDVAARGAHTL